MARGREETELLHHVHIVASSAVLDNLTVFDAVEVGVQYPHLPSVRRETKGLARN